MHWFHCKYIFPIWRAMANILTALGCGQYNCNRELVFLTLKRLRNGERRLINKHMRGIVWLTWKFLWQQLAEIGTSESGQGALDENLIFDSVFRIHYTCVLAALREHELVESRNARQPEKEAKGCERSEHVQSCTICDTRRHG